MSTAVINTTVDATIDLHELKQLEGSTQDVTTIILIRHGQSEYNVPVLIRGKDGVERKVMLVQGASLEVPLTELGQKQAHDLLGKLKGKFEHLNLHLVTSNAVRAQKTMEVFENYLEQKASIEPDLREIGSPAWEGQSKEEDNKEYKTQYSKWSKLSPQDQFVTEKLPPLDGNPDLKGESPNDVAIRAIAALDKAIKVSRALDEAEKVVTPTTILCTSHDGTMNFLALKIMYMIKGEQEQDGADRKPALSNNPADKPPYVDVENCDILVIKVPLGASVANGRVAQLIKTGVAVAGGAKEAAAPNPK
jgi:broad specificity phosphatase PhoE